jgi:hypothetical protein
MSSLRSRVKSAKAVLTFSPNVELPLRYRCRNPRCQCKLSVPTDSPRNAFCTRTCFTGYFRSRCLVCEEPFKRKQESQLTCSRPKCKAALRRDRAHFFGKWGGQSGLGCQTLGEAERGVRNPINTGIKSAHEPGRWRQVAGPPMSPQVLRLATIWVDRVVQLEQEQKAVVEAYLHHPNQARAAERETAYVAAVRRFRDHGWGKPVAAAALQIPTSCDWAPCKHPADEFLELPAFLCRKRES